MAQLMQQSGTGTQALMDEVHRLEDENGELKSSISA